MAGKGRDTAKKVLGGLVGIGIGVAGGYLIARVTDLHGMRDLDGGQFALVFAGGIALVALAAYLHIIIHEAGHLVAGLATGYRFSSFRVGSLMLVRRDGHLALKRFSLAGTGGQCLMAPPPMVGGTFPFVLYNAGGVLANLAASALCAVVWFASGMGATAAGGSLSHTAAAVFLAAMIFVGVAYALMNGIPLSTGPVPNDGRNVLHLGQNPRALRSIWLQLSTNATLSEGVRLRDMPQEWFEVPPAERLTDGLEATVGVFAENRLMDEHRFAEALELAHRLLEPEVGIADIYRHMLACDVACCDVLTGAPEDATDADFAVLDGREAKAVLKAMRDNPSVLRTRYTEALHARRPDEAQKVLARLDKVAPSYPYEADIASEREIMACVREVVG